MQFAAARRRALRRILATRTVGRQSELVQLLGEAGFQATQATVSRDLAEMGAVKRPDPGGQVSYQLPEESAPESGRALARSLAQFARTITPAGSLVVVKTPPGAAQVVAAAIDGGGLPGVVGTVAGDDTLVVVVEEQVGGWRIAKELERIGAGR